MFFVQLMSDANYKKGPTHSGCASVKWMHLKTHLRSFFYFHWHVIQMWINQKNEWNDTGNIYFLLVNGNANAFICFLPNKAMSLSIFFLNYIVVWTLRSFALICLWQIWYFYFANKQIKNKIDNTRLDSSIYRIKCVNKFVKMQYAEVLNDFSNYMFGPRARSICQRNIN